MRGLNRVIISGFVLQCAMAYFDCSECRELTDAARSAGAHTVSQRCLLHSREASLRKNFGLSLENVAQILELQRGLDPITLTAITTPEVEHDHKTGQIRAVTQHGSGSNRLLSCVERETWNIATSIQVLGKLRSYLDSPVLSCTTKFTLSRAKRLNTVALSKLLLEQQGLTRGALLDQQQGQCPICEAFLSKSSPLDHDHVTQHVRGLLCHTCNQALGVVEPDRSRVDRAIRYLQDPPARKLGYSIPTPEEKQKAGRERFLKNHRLAMGLLEVNARRGASLKKMHADPGVKQRHRDSLKRAWSDPEARAARSATMQRVWLQNSDEKLRKLKVGRATPEAKQAHSEGLKRLHSDPEYQRQFALAHGAHPFVCVETGKGWLSKCACAAVMRLHDGDLGQHLKYPDKRQSVGGFHFRHLTASELSWWCSVGQPMTFTGPNSVGA